MQKDEKGITVKKEENFSEWYTQVVQKAELADIRLGIQGFVVHRPWGFQIIKKIYKYLETEVEKQGHEEFLFPIAVKEDNLKKEKEHAGFTPNVFWVSEAGDKKIEERFALRPTGEAQIYPLYSLWFRSWKELPFLGYQSRISVYRNEMATRPFIRGREFLFFETHDVFYTHKEALEQIEKDLETCKKVIQEKTKIPFYYFKRPDWDRFKGADATYTPDTLMPDGKRIQLASTHDLGQNFSKVYNITVTGKDEKEHYAYQTCFGPGIWRIMAALISIHGDDKGLVLPFNMAPKQIVIVPILKGEDDTKLIKVCRELEQKLIKLGYKTTCDDSEETPGYKYNKWELKGVPIRLEIGSKELKEKTITIALRTGGKKKTIKEKGLQKELKESIIRIDKEIEKRANQYFKDSTKDANTIKDLKILLENFRGFVKIPFCTMTKEGEQCANKLKTETQGADITGTKYPMPEAPKKGQKCLICGKEARHIVYAVKSY